MYYHGRVSNAAGSATITGLNTLWNSGSPKRVDKDLHKFMFFDDPSTVYDISSVDSDTQITLGSTVTGKHDYVYYIIDSNSTIKTNFYPVSIETSFDILYTFYLNDASNTIFRFTDRPSNSAAGYEYPSGSGTYYISRGVTYNNLVHTITGETQSLELVVENLKNDLFDYFTVNGFRRALVTINGVYRWDDANYNSFLMKSQVEKVSCDDKEARFLLAHIDDTLRLKMITMGQNCQFGFWYDTRCGVARPAAEDTYDIDHASTTAGVLYIANSSTVKADDYYDFSEVAIHNDTPASDTLVKLVHGVNWERDDVDDTKGSITMRSPLRSSEFPESGWKAVFRRDCNRSWEHCTDRFSNNIRYGGWKHITEPVQNLSGAHD